MANAAKIVEGPAGTPTQEFWDGLINGIENCPNLDTINGYIDKLYGYIDKMNAAVSQLEKEIYDATLGEFEKCKQEVLDYLEEKVEETQDTITSVSQGKVEELVESETELEEEIEDLETDIANITAENSLGAAVDVPPAGTIEAVTAWAASVSAWRTAQKTTILGYVNKFRHEIDRIKKKFDPIVAAVAWWPVTIGQLATYMARRVADLTNIITRITQITPPSFPSVPSV